MTDKTEKLFSLVTAYNRRGDGVIDVRRSEPMSLHTSFRIGGAADLYLTPENERSLVDLVGMIKECEERTYFLGNGTNVLFSDDGYRGTVVSLAGLREIKTEGDTVTAGAGAPLITVCKAARDASLAGMEFAYGIPGSVGGAVYMNAGAYGGVTADILTKSRYLDLSDLTLHEITLAEHEYGYRESVYRHTTRVILSAEFGLTHGEKDEITAKMNEIMQRRVDKQPLDKPSAGSVFKRCEGHFTGQMIEESGLKGFAIGGAQVSEKHAGFIVNTGSATADDVLRLIDYIRGVIRKNYGLELECEMIYVE